MSAQKATDPLAELRTQVQALLDEVKGLREAAGSGDAAWGRGNTAVGHPDARTGHPNANPYQPTLTGKELEDKVLDLETRLSALEGGSK